jgi:hypothetical protein
MWSLLALFTIGSAPVPPFLLNALCFGIGRADRAGLDGAARVWRAARRVVAGLCLRHARRCFGYHFLYFTAFRLAPLPKPG